MERDGDGESLSFGSLRLCYESLRCFSTMMQVLGKEDFASLFQQAASFADDLIAISASNNNDVRQIKYIK